MKIDSFYNIKLFPFIKDLKRYKLKKFKDDSIAAFSVALLTIPQSIAYSLLAGLPPSAGLFAAIFGCFFVGLFGSSRHLIAGPTTAIAILLQTSIAEIIYDFYPSVAGVEKDILILNILSHIVVVMGIIQLAFGLFNMGKILQFVSRAVILGYFAGVIVAIVVNQLFPFFGISFVSTQESLILRFWDFATHINQVSFVSAIVGLLSVFFLVYFKKKFPRFPGTLFVLIVISSFCFILKYYNFLGSGFSHLSFLEDTGISSFPKVLFKFPIFDWRIITKIFPAALATSMLGILEIFSVSRSVATESGQIVNPNQEMFSFGIGNFILSFMFGAMPASGSISRSLFNLRSKAQTRFASLFSSIFVTLLIVLFWPFVKHIPLVMLSAILLSLIPSFLDFKQIKLCLTVTKGDAIVFLLTFVSCLIFSLYIALFIGIAISIASYLKRAAVPHVVEYGFNSSGRLTIVSKKKGYRKKIRIVGIAGELFFGSVDLFQTTFQHIAKDPFVKVIVLRLNNVYYMDASMCWAILHLHQYLSQSKKELIISGITSEIWQLFLKSGIVEKIGEMNLFVTSENNPQLSTWNACMRAKDLIT